MKPLSLPCQCNKHICIPGIVVSVGVTASVDILPLHCNGDIQGVLEVTISTGGTINQIMTHTYKQSISKPCDTCWLYWGGRNSEIAITDNYYIHLLEAIQLIKSTVHVNFHSSLFIQNDQYTCLWEYQHYQVSRKCCIELCPPKFHFLQPFLISRSSTVQQSSFQPFQTVFNLRLC